MDTIALKSREAAFCYSRSGSHLDNFGKMLGIKRKRWWTWVFKESDAKYKARLFKIAYSGAHYNATSHH